VTLCSLTSLYSPDVTGAVNSSQMQFGYWNRRSWRQIWVYQWNCRQLISRPPRFRPDLCVKRSILSVCSGTVLEMLKSVTVSIGCERGSRA